MDLESEGKVLSIDQLKMMHTKKTGALFTASILMGAVCGNPNKLEWEALKEAGEAIGLAFQIQDDILDQIASTETLGKIQGRDQVLGKSTFPRLLGLTASKKEAYALMKIANTALERVDGNTNILEMLARLSVERTS
jgi:geranylgeranyl pyrophosphate synthase